MTKKHILFVDDDATFLLAFQEALRIAEPNWVMASATRGAEALQLLSSTPFDVVVADFQMPEMDGADLLDQVQQQSPQTMRFILSGQLDPDDIIRLSVPAHQCFSKPLSLDVFRQTIRRVFGLRDLLSNDVLRRLIAQCSLLPTIPSLYIELGKELQSPHSSIDRVEAIIARDPSVTAKILQLVNSSFFGLPRRIESLGEAINYVGLQIIKALVLTVPVYSRFDGVRVRDYSPAAIWEHCWRTGVLARCVAQEEHQASAFCEEAFLAGLLHDLGKMVLIANLSSLCREATALATRAQISMHEAEKQVFGCTHSQVAAYLLGLWGLPESIVEAVAFHNEPMESPSNQFSPLTAVHVGNALDHAYSEGKPEHFKQLADVEYLMSLGLTARLDAWQNAGLIAFQRAKQASGE
jgi:HD-like signal output (HDOD) protein